MMFPEKTYTCTVLSQTTVILGTCMVYMYGVWYGILIIINLFYDYTSPRVLVLVHPQLLELEYM